MCGNAGLFIGCPEMDSCSLKRALVSKMSPHDQDIKYVSKLETWDTKATVRAAPRRVLEEESGKYYFSPDFVPITKHKLIKDMAPSCFRNVLVQHLYRYLDFTAKLEHIVVNRIALTIAQGYVDIRMPDEMRFDAYKLYCDEAYHALFSADLIRQVKKRSGIEPRTNHVPDFLYKLRELQRRQPEKELKLLIEIFFVIVSETLISASLAEIPNDPNVVSTVREVVNDHAVDEGRHHAYFASFLRILWPQLSDKSKRFIGPILPELILNFLRPDFSSLRNELTKYNLGRDEVEQIIAETYPQKVITDGVGKMARTTIKYFEENGILTDPATRDAFFRSGLIS